MPVDKKGNKTVNVDIDLFYELINKCSRVQLRSVRFMQPQVEIPKELF